jgi:hypothetical protein
MFFCSGALFVEGDESAAQEAAFRHAIDLVKDQKASTFC